MPVEAPLEAKAPTGATLGRATFERVAALAAREAGLLIPPTKLAMVQSRLSRRIRAVGLDSFEAYLDLVERQDSAEERRQMISVLTTNGLFNHAPAE